ncbi:lytic transglycosylase domain-containing protein [Solitalea koreensis]|uniref:Transglycosylase SLT domain-containing protein n=1 Tax=Solitalea koreensis TaxID=543615 RepID=A0A521CS11_9SPHI|nr:lytic transglycosylase domain-containing protein [Solitalea koreensis]SMO62234.1 Transglycosylase SLT domain-containing protein [Solitalea koreensis]
MRKTIKKYFITCSTVVLILTVANLFFFNIQNGFSVSKAYMDAPVVAKKISKPALNFAGENIPENDPTVKTKLKAAVLNCDVNKQNVHRSSKRLKKWFAVIEPILKRHGIPEDFKYIPFIESGFKSDTSVKGAAGYWQFMPATARNYGLRVDDVVDERYDIQKSTNSACRYLKELYREFGSWTMVAAAYNIGSTKLQQHTKNQDEDNYFRLHLNTETGRYVYRILAVKEMLKQAEVKHNVGSKIIVNKPGYSINLSSIYVYDPEFVASVLSSIKNNFFARIKK